MLDKGLLEVMLSPRSLLELGFRPPPHPLRPHQVSMKVSIVLLFPGIWSQTSARAQSPFYGSHTKPNSLVFALHPPSSLENLDITFRKNKQRLTEVAAYTSEAQKLGTDFVLCSSITNRPTLR